MLTFLYILLGVLMFGVIIMIHELGHFLTAKAFDVGIEEFSIGMGPKIYSRIGKDGVCYSIRAVPIGGFVSMVGENEDTGDSRALCRKPVWQRMIIVSAGAVMNFIFGFILMAVTVMMAKNVYSTTIEGFLVSRDGVVSTESAFGDLQAGDTVLKINNRKVNVRSDFVYEIMLFGADPVDVTVRRNGKALTLHDFQFPSYNEGGILMGNAMFVQMTTLEKTLSEVAKQAVFQSFSTLRMMWFTILNTFRGEYGTEALSGPVGIVGQVQETVSIGWDAFLSLITMITLNLGIMNLLPLPALDGGRLLFMFVELVRGKPVNPKYEGYVHAAGLMVLMGLMVFVTYNDIVRIFTR